MAWLDQFLLKLENPLSKVFVPGFKGVPLWDVLKFMYLEVQRDSIQIRAASIAFNTFLSLFPSIIIFFEMVSLIPIDTLETTLFSLLGDMLPRSAYFFIVDSIREVNERNPHTGVISLGFILAFFFASNGVNSMLQAFRKHADLIEKQRGFIRQRLVAIFVTFLLILVVVFSLIGVIGGQLLINRLIDDMLYLTSRFSISAVIVLKWLMSFILIFNAVSVIYYFAPAIKDKWSYFSPGSILATILCIITSLLFNWYINSFGKYSLLYGSIGTAIVLMLWIYLNAMIVIIGFELNLGIDVNKHKINIIDESL